MTLLAITGIIVIALAFIKVIKNPLLKGLVSLVGIILVIFLLLP